MLQTVLAALAAYALGCLVGAYYVVRLRAGHDVRETGSGNAGARNVLRSGDRFSAVLTLLWDVAKGALAVWLARSIARADVAVSLAIVAVVAGHIWPAQLQFRGGKGVATTIGTALAVLPLVVSQRSWVLVAGVAVASAIVIVMHHPTMHRGTRAPAVQPAQENG